jgi:tyrosinase
MRKTTSPLTRRSFLKTSLVATAGAASLPLTARSFILPMAKYTRYNVTSDAGRKALMSYGNAIKTMLTLPPTHPHNWFRNAFVHILDCPHGNWWFYVWHRGFMGYFEETIRNISGDPAFAIPYWDWTTLAEIPSIMFDGVLTPTDAAYAPYTKNLAVFSDIMGPAMTTYWNNLTPAQRVQLDKRGYTSFDLMWNDINGYSPSAKQSIAGNIAYAITCGARYLTRDNPKFDARTADAVSRAKIDAGLQPTDFYNSNIALSFNSERLDSHNYPPGAFSVLEGFPHNKVHNYIGGVGPIAYGPWGNMTNFLSPVDPIFFLHHSNMDRLWDVWTRKQISIGKPYLPSATDAPKFNPEPFLFFVNGKGEYVLNGQASDYLSMDRFDYQYAPGGYGDDFSNISAVSKKGARPQIRGTVKANTARLAVPSDAVQEHLASPRAATLIAEVAIPHPTPTSPTREFDVLVGAPADVTSAGPDSPYYAGTIAFFGNMSAHAAHSPAAEARFAVPLPKSPQAFKALGAATTTVDIRIVPAHGRGTVPMLKSAVIRSL